MHVLTPFSLIRVLIVGKTSSDAAGVNELYTLVFKKQKSWALWRRFWGPESMAG